MNRKGIVESGVMVILAMILGVATSAGALYGGGGVFTSNFITGSSVLTAYSQMPHVKRDFREKKAVREFGITQEKAESLSDDALLDLIRDNEVSSSYLNYGYLYKAEGDDIRIAGR